LISMIAIALTAIQVLTMDTRIKDEAHDKYQSSVDSVNQADSTYRKFLSSELLAKRDIGNFKTKKANPVISNNTSVVKRAARYWTTTGVELYKKDVVGFSMYFDDKATFNVNGKNQKLKVGDKLAVGKLIQKQKYKESNKFTGNTKLGKEYSGKILALAARYVYVEHYKSNLAVKFKPNQNATTVSRDLVPAPTNENVNKDVDNKSDKDTGGGRRRRPWAMSVQLLCVRYLINIVLVEKHITKIKEIDYEEINRNGPDVVCH